MNNPLVQPDAQPGQAVAPKERVEQISRSLADAARRLRFSTTGRATVPGSYSARREERFTRLLRIGSFVGFVAIPSVAALLYFGLIASDQYVAEAKFAVRGGALAGIDPISSMTGIPSARVIQDTQVVTDFIGSRALVQLLLDQVDLRGKYSTDEADFYARLNPEKPIERIVKYWEKMHSAQIELPGGIVTLKVRAFRRDDAVAIASAVVDASETLVNDMNARARQDAVENAEKQFERAGEKLGKSRAALELARNTEGLLDTSAQTKKSLDLIGAIRGQQLELQQQLAAAQRSVSRDAPQLRSIQFQIEAAEKQLTQLQAELTTTAPVPGAAPALSASITRLSTLEIEHRVNEKEYGEAISRLERARASNNVKQIYLTTFVRPVLPEEAEYPKRGYWILGTIVVGLLSWAIVYSLAMFVRNNRA